MVQGFRFDFGVLGFDKLDIDSSAPIGIYVGWEGENGPKSISVLVKSRANVGLIIEYLKWPVSI